MMGLAPYGNPKFENQIKDNLDKSWHSDGSFSLNMDFFEYCTSLYMIGENSRYFLELRRANQKLLFTNIMLM